MGGSPSVLCCIACADSLKAELGEQTESQGDVTAVTDAHVLVRQQAALSRRDEEEDEAEGGVCTNRWNLPTGFSRPVNEGTEDKAHCACGKPTTEEVVEKDDVFAGARKAQPSHPPGDIRAQPTHRSSSPPRSPVSHRACPMEHQVDREGSAKISQPESEPASSSSGEAPRKRPLKAAERCGSRGAAPSGSYVGCTNESYRGRREIPRVSLPSREHRMHPATPSGSAPDYRRAASGQRGTPEIVGIIPPGPNAPKASCLWSLPMCLHAKVLEFLPFRDQRTFVRTARCLDQALPLRLFFDPPPAPRLRSRPVSAPAPAQRTTAATPTRPIRPVFLIGEEVSTADARRRRGQRPAPMSRGAPSLRVTAQSVDALCHRGNSATAPRAICTPLVQQERVRVPSCSAQARLAPAQVVGIRR
mmetsp:Transcript_310/g.1062  ORF Transcript_310/g.1062 Transcript_310/m.1062 type:complete len:417 (-) Transcript_310:5-1255(-)